MKLVLLIASIVVYAITAIFAFTGNLDDLHSMIGLLAVGSAAFAGSFLPIP